MMQAAWIGLTTLLLLVSLIRPLYPFEQTLQHIPTVIGLILLAVAARRQWLSPQSIAAICLFLWLHILGARYIYTYVPYDEWTDAVFGKSLSDALGWQRNHYDRLVHFAYGFLASIPIYELARSRGKLGPPAAILIVAAAALGTSALYEIAEWMLTLFVSPEQARRYNGQQGDIWDAQKDMALALAGMLSFDMVLSVRKCLR